MAMFGNLAREPLGIQSAQQIMPGDQPMLNTGVGKVSNSPFRQGGKGWQILGMIGDALQTATGGRATFADAQRWWDEQEAERERQAQERQDRLNTPSIINTKAGVMSATPAGDIRMLYEAPPEAPEYDAYAGLFGARGTPAYLRGAQDYILRGNGPTAIGLRTDLKQVAPGKAGGGVTPTARAKLVAEAEAAIARGAPRDQVMARLAKMGIQ